MRFFVLIGLITISSSLLAQKVGLVLSGGGAKGLAHVGVLKALEENNIPINYLTGTSMGGVVAACYASGLSAKEIEALFLSDNFQRWINGKLEKGYNFFYSQDAVNPSFLRIHLTLDSTRNFDLKSNLANDLSLNFALAETFTLPSAIAKNNFDSLFVPLRLMASDIFTQSQVILKRGNLSDAVRATHTVPLFYEPIKVNNQYLFDGGVYNNFPVKVMQQEFSPDAIIGVNVSSKVYDEYPYDQDENLVSKSLILMLLDKSDPKQVPESGVYIHPNLKGISGIEFASVRSSIDSGYAQTMRQMPEIKRKIQASVSNDQLRIARERFLSKRDTFLVEKVKFIGFNSKQRKYLNRFFSVRKGVQPFKKIKTDYYSLVSDEYFKNVYPSFTQDSASKKFQFQITRRPQKNFQVDFGGVISNRNISSLFLGFNHYYFNRVLMHNIVNFYVGSFHKSAQFATRIDFPTLGRFYIEPEAVFNDWNFFNGRDLLIGEKKPTVLKRIDRSVGISAGIPFSKELKFSVHANAILNSDSYSNKDDYSSKDTLDVLQLSGYRSGFLVETNDLNRKQYANSGKHFALQFDWFSLTEKYTPGNTDIYHFANRNHTGWVRLKFTAEQYLRTGIYSSGYFLQGVFSNQPFFTNYMGSLINAPAFNPLQDSRTLLLQKFRAYNYLAGGVRNIFSLRSNLDLRLEAYIFKPIRAIIKENGFEPGLSDKIGRISFAGSAALVLHTTIGPVALSFNYYNDQESRFGLILHAGYLLFQKSSMD